jgi:hypothetical protein
LSDNNNEINYSLENSEFSRISFINSNKSYIFNLNNNIMNNKVYLKNITIRNIISSHFNSFIKYNERNNVFKNISLENPII